MLALRGFVASISVALLAAPVFAAQQSSDTEIIVQGSLPPDRSEIVDRVRQGYPARALREPLMRYLEPICLQVNGLGDAGNAEVLSQMRDTISSLSIPLAQPDCVANAVVVVSTQPIAQLERFHDRSPRILSADTLEQKSAEFAGGAHVIVWHNRTIRGADGEALPISGGIAGWTGVGGVEALTNNNGRASRIRAGYSVAADLGVVIYDANRLDNVELRQLANHAVMRLLTPGFEIEIEAGSSESVLSGIEDGSGPIELSRFDRALLRALYGLAPNAPGSTLGLAVSNQF